MEALALCGHDADVPKYQRVMKVIPVIRTHLNKLLFSFFSSLSLSLSLSPNQINMMSMIKIQVFSPVTIACVSMAMFFLVLQSVEGGKKKSDDVIVIVNNEPRKPKLIPVPFYHHFPEPHLHHETMYDHFK